MCDTAIAKKADLLVDAIRGYGSCAIAFSGGVDSAVVAKAAHLALGERAVAVTGVSSSLAAGELEAARALAAEIGICHREIATDEFANSAYTANAADRCFHCKTELYSQLVRRLEELGVGVIASGTNAEDLGDYRPGLEAARQYSVCHPLAECGFSKAEVRELAALWQLPVADKPAAPCLSSRLAYGVEVTPERLTMVDRAEKLLRDMGLPEVRVRCHAGDLARIEVPAEAIQRLADPATRFQLTRQFRELGFKYVTLDLEGFRSGSLNLVVPVDALTQFA